MLNKILIVLVFLAVACIGVIFYNLEQLIQYKQCMNTPINNMPEWCNEIIQN